MTFDAVKSFLKQIEFPGYEFSVENDGDQMTLILDIVADKRLHLATWSIDRMWTRSSIVRMLFEKIEEHQTMLVHQRFQYRGRPIFTVLLDVDRLWDVTVPENMDGAQ